MRPVLGSTATTAPLYRPSAATAAARTIGSSYAASSLLVESAKVGTPRYRAAYLRARLTGVPAAGAAGKGMAQMAAIKIARLAFPNCFTEPTFLRDPLPVHPPCLPRAENRLGSVFYLTLSAGSTNIHKRCSLPSSAVRP